MEIIKLL